MAMFKKILAPTDFSELSAKGVRYAGQMAKDAGAELIILNVVLLDETNTIHQVEMDRHKARLDNFVADKVPEAGRNLKVRKLVDAGNTYGAIVDCADIEHVDLIVMSSHGRSGLTRMLIGSVTDKVLRGASCPVLVVPVEKGKN